MKKLYQTYIHTISTTEYAIPSAGYVHLNDTTYKSYDSTQLDNLYGTVWQCYNRIQIVWVAKDTTGGKDWNVYKLYDTNIKIDNVIANGDANTAMKVTISGTGLPK